MKQRIATHGLECHSERSDLLLGFKLSAFGVTEQSDHFEVTLSQNLNFLGRIVTVSDDAGWCVIVSKPGGGRTTDQSTVISAQNV